MEKIRPMLFTTLKKYSGAQLMSDVVAGIIVAIIALPLSIALALASGVGPEQGIYTAIAAGFVISFLGGSQVQIAGPTAAFATIVAGIVARSGVEGLAVATILAGIILVIMGFCQLGSLIKFIPFTITTGFTSGIAVTIVIGQLKDFFGVTYPAGMETIETMQKLKAFAAGFGTMNVHAVIVGLVCLAILIVMPKITEKIPGSLVAVLAGIVMVKFLPLQVNTIGDLYSVSNALPAFHMPAFSYDVIQGVDEQLREMVAEHTANHVEEPLQVSRQAVVGILEDCGVSEERVEAFDGRYREVFGEEEGLSPRNLVDSTRVTLTTPGISVQVKPECSRLVETKYIDGAKYILIRVEEGVEVNGIPVKFQK